MFSSAFNIFLILHTSTLFQSFYVSSRAGGRLIFDRLSSGSLVYIYSFRVHVLSARWSPASPVGFSILLTMVLSLFLDTFPIFALPY